MKILYTLFLVFTSLFVVAQVPPNDTCNTATNITQLDNFCSNAAQYTNVGATSTGFGTPTCWTGYSHEVWFKFTAIASDVVISIYGNESGNGTLNSPQIALFSGTCVVASEIGCKNALAGENYVTLYEGGLTAGVTYYIRVDGAGTNTGTFKFCINNYTPVLAPGQDCNSATYLCKYEYD